MRLVYLTSSIEHQVERLRSTIAPSIKGTDTSTLHHQKVEQLYGSRVGPLQIIEDNDQGMFCCQRLEVMGHSTIEVTAFHFRTDWLRLWQVWQFEAYFRCNFCQVNSRIAEHTAQLFRTT